MSELELFLQGHPNLNDTDAWVSESVSEEEEDPRELQLEHLMSGLGLSYWPYHEMNSVDGILDDFLRRYCKVSDDTVINIACEWVLQENINIAQLSIVPYKVLKEKWGLHNRQIVLYQREVIRFVLQYAVWESKV